MNAVRSAGPENPIGVYLRRDLSEAWQGDRPRHTVVCTQAMNQHLIEVSRNVADDGHAILIMDWAGWHVSNKLIVPENITILPLPPKSPE